MIADVDDDGAPEIVTAHSGGYVSVYNAAGYFEPGWPQQPTGNELRGLSVYDLDGDGTLEIAVTGAVYGKTNTWVYEHDGALRPGWPQLTNDSGYAYGVFNDNAALGDLDGDGTGELVVPSDVHYINAFEPNGAQIPANAIYGGKGWGKVGVWESLAIELRGWGTCTNGDPRAERYRANFAHGPAAIADMNGDGVNEVIAVGNMYDCIPGYPSKYNAAFVFNADRSRFKSGGYNWESIPIDTGAPLNEDYNVIESDQPNPAIADLDGDGEREILYASYDGRVHAFWLDKTEHGSWPYSVYNPGEGFYRFASEPVVADLDGDGQAEVIFTSWTQKGSHQTGKLHILDYLGNPLYEVPLPDAYGSPDWNGALAAPTLANIDSDPDLEVVVNTAHSGVAAYDLPGTANARLQWWTGRGNYQRSASYLAGSLLTSSKQASELTPAPGGTLTYTIVLENPGPALEDVAVSDSLPAGLTYAGNLSASSGTPGYAAGVVTWEGEVPGGAPVTIAFDASVDAGIGAPQLIVNAAQIDDGLGNVLTKEAVIVVDGVELYLPLARR